ncbi:MAG: PH domain-containing protein [Thermoplasmata archaeon]
MNEEGSDSRDVVTSTGRPYLVALVPLALLVLLGLYGPLVHWMFLGGILPATPTDLRIGRLLLGAYREGQYGVLLLLMFCLAASAGLLGAWMTSRGQLQAVLARRFLNLGPAVLMFLWVALLLTVATLAVANMLALVAGATLGFGFPAGFPSSLAVQLWSGAMVGLSAFATAMGGIAFYHWRFQKVPELAPSAVFPRQFFAGGERIHIEIKPRMLPFLLRSLVPVYLLGFFLLIFVLPTGGNPTVLSAVLRLFGIPLAFIAGLALVTSYLRWRATFYAVTDRRIMLATGLVGRSFNDMRHGKVQNVTLNQNAFQRWRGYGTVTFASAGTAGPTLGNIVFLGVVNPIGVRRRAQEIIDRSQERKKKEDYRTMAETFKEVEASPMPRQVRRVVTVTERKPAKFCEFCGAEAEGAPRFCEKCGNRIN